MALEAPTWLYVMWSSWDSRASLRGEMILFGFLNFLEQNICPPPFILFVSTSTQDLAFVGGGGFSCWLVSATSPNSFESIVFVGSNILSSARPR